MGLRRRLRRLTRRVFKSKLSTTASEAVTRLAVMKNQHEARARIGCSDVLELIQLGSIERALFRVEVVIKEQNVLDVLVMLESYCYLLMERASLIEEEEFCPDELKEATSTLVFASARFGEVPELLKIRSMFASKYGKEFVSRAVELRNNCGVNPKIVRLLSTRMSSLEIRMKMLMNIAAENNIRLSAEDTISYTEMEQKQKHQIPQKMKQVEDEEQGRQKKIDEMDAVEKWDLQDNETRGRVASKRGIHEDENVKGDQEKPRNTLHGDQVNFMLEESISSKSTTGASEH